MLCENMQGREEDELLGMDEVFLRTSVKDKGVGDAGSAVHSFLEGKRNK